MKPKNEDIIETQIPIYDHFMFGAIGGMASQLVVQPLEVIKNRMQISTKYEKHKSMKEIVQTITKKSGYLGLYHGISSGLLRTATLTGTRIGIYNYLVLKYEKQNNGEPLSVTTKTLMAVASSFVATLVGQPADLALVRMTTSEAFGVLKPIHYKNVFTAMASIVQKEGILTLWSGAPITLIRSTITSLYQFEVYPIVTGIVEVYLGLNGILGTLVSATINGKILTKISCPFDVVKTRLMAPVHIYEWTTSVKTLNSLLRKEGPSALWKGSAPYYLRITPNTLITFMVVNYFITNYEQKHCIVPR